MARKHEFKAFDAVELSEWVGDVPVGSRGGLLEFPDPDLAMVELTEPPLGAVDRILSCRFLGFVSLGRRSVAKAPTVRVRRHGLEPPRDG